MIFIKYDLIMGENKWWMDWLELLMDPWRLIIPNMENIDRDHIHRSFPSLYTYQLTLDWNRGHLLSLKNLWKMNMI